MYFGSGLPSIGVFLMPPDWREFAARRPFLTLPASGRYGTGKVEKIANTGHIGRRRRRHPANVGWNA